MKGEGHRKSRTRNSRTRGNVSKRRQLSVLFRLCCAWPMREFRVPAWTKFVVGLSQTEMGPRTKGERQYKTSTQKQKGILKAHEVARAREDLYGRGNKAGRMGIILETESQIGLNVINRGKWRQYGAPGGPYSQQKEVKLATRNITNDKKMN